MRVLSAMTLSFALATLLGGTVGSTTFLRATPAMAQEGAKVTLPETPAGKQMAGLIQALNGGDSAKIRGFIKSNFAPGFLHRLPLEDHVRVNVGFALKTGGVTLQKIVSSDTHALSAILIAKKTQEALLARLEVEETAPNNISGLGFRLINSVMESLVLTLPKGKLSEEQMVKTLDTFLQNLAKADMFSGTILVAKEGKPLYTKACGLASVAWNAPNRLNTKFNLGSMNKMFTAVSILQLVEQGKLNLNDPIGKYLTDYPNKEVAAKVTLHHLLTHTSGIGDYFNEKFEQASRERFRVINDYLPLFVDKPLEFEPGARFRYSNAGFMVLGAIVQKVSGQDYFAYVREHIYKPAGMIDTDAYELDYDTPNLATGYTREGQSGEERKGPRRNNVFMHVIKGGPAGGGYSTVEDLLHFDQALRSHKLLNAKSLELLTTGKVRMGGSTQYAYGMMDTLHKGNRIIGHSGGFPGLNSQLDMYWDSGYTVAVMSNYDDGASPVAEAVRQMLTQK